MSAKSRRRVNKSKYKLNLQNWNWSRPLCRGLNDDNAHGTAPAQLATLLATTRWYALSGLWFDLGVLACFAFMHWVRLGSSTTTLCVWLFFWGYLMRGLEHFGNGTHTHAHTQQNQQKVCDLFFAFRVRNIKKITRKNNNNNVKWMRNSH